MSIPMVKVTEVVEVVMRGAKHAVAYINPHETVKATYHGKRHGRSRTKIIVVTAGRPNYDEREFIKRAIKARKRFPLLVVKS